jgi:hypothetical protein
VVGQDTRTVLHGIGYDEERIDELAGDEEGRFERGLTRLLDGIALEIDR